MGISAAPAQVSLGKGRTARMLCGKLPARRRKSLHVRNSDQTDWMARLVWFPRLGVPSLIATTGSFSNLIKEHVRGDS
jgi:hypothetical protein